MKFFDTLRAANSNLSRNKVRTILTIIAIFVGAFTLALTTGIDTGVNRYIDAQLGSIGGENTLIIMPKPSEETTGIVSSDKVKEYEPASENTAAQDTSGATGASMGSTMKPISEETLKKISAINGV